MADTIKIGSLDISAFKVGSSDCKIYLGDTLLYPQDATKDYFRFVSKGTGTFTFFDNGSDTANTLSYSLDSGATWTEILNGSSTSTVQSGDTVMWKGSNLTSVSNKGIGTFSATTNFDAEGNIMSLIYGDNFEGETSLSGMDYVFMNLFSGCTSVINAENMELPATTLSQQCYCNFFNRASNLTTAPSTLPAMTLENGCYFNMFYVCSAMTVAPELPALTLVTDCYKQMFRGCSSLSHIKAMFTTKPTTAYTSSWVYGVASSGTFVKNSSATWNVSGQNGVPNGWTITTASS